MIKDCTGSYEQVEMTYFTLRVAMGKRRAPVLFQEVPESSLDLWTACYLVGFNALRT